MSEASTRFAMGQTVATRNAMHHLSEDDVYRGLDRHARGDWGDLDAHDLRENERALSRGGRLFSAYRSQDGTKFWIITEADRSVTTVLLPEDY